MNIAWARRAGWAAIIAGVGGAGGALFLMLVPPAVSPELANYPLTAGGFAVTQCVFAAHHLLMAAAIWMLWRSEAAGPARFAGWATAAAAGSLALLGVWELVAITQAGHRNDDPGIAWIGAGYGVGTILTGATLVLLGIAVIRAQVLRGWVRWIALATGVYVFVPMLPLLFLSFASGRIVIGAWLLLFAVLGVGLLSAAARRAAAGISTATPPQSAR